MPTPLKSKAQTPGAPVQLPPVPNAGNGETAVVEAEPMAVTEAEINAALASIAAAPTLEPPVAQAAAVTAVWVNTKKVNALWSINQNHNVWAGFEDVGWRKFAANFDSTAMAFAIISASAKDTQTVTNRREEADKMVHELYVW